MRKIAGVTLLIILTACASLSKDECRTADWQMIGYEDGSRGRLLNTIGNHRKACAKVGVTPDMAAYEAGHQKGVRTYCTSDQGFKLGVGGGLYNGICGASRERDFLRGYAAGKERHDLRKNVAALEKKIADYYGDLDDMAADAEAHEQALLAETTPAAERKEHLRAIKSLQRQRAEMREDLRHLEAEFADRQEALDELLLRQSEWPE